MLLSQVVILFKEVMSLYCLMQHHISEDLNLYRLCCENLKFHIKEVVVVYTSHLGVLCTLIKLFKQSLKISFLCACVHAWCHWKWCTCFVASDQVRLVSTVVVCPSRYLTYLLTLWSTVHLEKLTGFQLVKKFPSFYGTQRFITPFTSACHLSLS
jgi:hypothetical protein